MTRSRGKTATQGFSSTVLEGGGVPERASLVRKKQKQEDKCEEGINSDPTSVTLETGSMRGDCSRAEEGLPHSLTAKEGAMMYI